MNKIIILIAIIGLWFAYQNHSTQQTEEPVLYNETTISKPIEEVYTKPSKIYKCDGRQYCSQMSSCEEATYFLNNCPNPKMDGNNDGIPCEKQWCY